MCLIIFVFVFYIYKINWIFIGILYAAPEVRKNREQNRRRNADKVWIKQTQNVRQASDIYAFGVVMYEILFRSLPFPEGTQLEGILERKKIK